MKRIIANGDGVAVTEPGPVFYFFYRFPPFRFLFDLLTYGFGWHGDIVLGNGAYSKSNPIAKGRGRYFYLTRDVHCRNLTVQETYVLYTQGHKIRCRESIVVDGQILDEPIKP